MTIIRTAFWLSVVVFLLPSGKDADTTKTVSANPQEHVTLNSAVHAASQTAGDVAGFCTRNPDVCATGKAALHTFGEKAKYGAQKVMEWAASPSQGEGIKPNSTLLPSPETTASIGKQADASSVLSTKGNRWGKADRQPVKVKGKARRPSQNTLTRDDLEPAWKGPKTA